MYVVFAIIFKLKGTPVFYSFGYKRVWNIVISRGVSNRFKLAKNTYLPQCFSRYLSISTKNFHFPWLLPSRYPFNHLIFNDLLKLWTSIIYSAPDEIAKVSSKKRVLKKETGSDPSRIIGVSSAYCESLHSTLAKLTPWTILSFPGAFP